MSGSYYNKIINGDLETRATFKKNKVDHDLEILIESIPRSTTQYQDFEDNDPERDIELYNKHVLEHNLEDEPDFIYDSDGNNSEFFMN